MRVFRVLNLLNQDIFLLKDQFVMDYVYFCVENSKDNNK